MHFLKATGLVAILALGPLSASAQEAEWTPRRNIEFIVPYSAGGGSDLNARALSEAIRKNRLIPRNMMILNRPGGSGAVGNSYVASRTAEPHTLMTFNSGQMMSMLTNNAQVRLDNITPLGTLALDTLVFVVRADSPYESFADLAEAARAAPQTLTVGGSGRGGEDNLVFALANQPAEGALQYVPFEGGGDALAAVLGGHVTVGIFNPSEISAQIEGGSVKGLGIFSEQRLEGAFAEVPTFVEQGHPDAVFEMFRGYAGPPDLPPEAIAYWNGVLSQVSQSDEWKEDIERNSLIPAYMDAEESAAFWKREEARYLELLTDLGFIQ
ncbi:Bug family tripartite tricarboxylate transporter substrate binding protein [Aureimonas frigidaquae]|uniref:Uncharacterized protein n=1 Tax=Aureimonas frigidaquae TaxID=424757 RepID=A0A0P0Z3H9_9HYPH|nr:tripartite tricarboxylate transporter substrate-binding protein [Aureimonas frigidaquae]BAT28540.1 hypothetical protein [Aureimonas frigidaquae]